MIAWHYTIADRALAILKSGFIYPATAGVPEGERPVVWFSAQTHWEPTANKIVVLPGGYQRIMTTKEMFAHCELWRFGTDIRNLIPWMQLRSVARIKRFHQRRMIAAAHQVHADPIKWYGSLCQVPTEYLSVEVFHDQWRPAPEFDLKVNHTTSGS